MNDRRWRDHWYHYSDWECVRAGMYVPATPTEESVAEAAAVLGDATRCRAAMRDVFDQWPVSVAQAMSDRMRNRRAWLGRACVCMAAGHPESVTRVAWFTLSQEQQANANAVADALIAEWDDTNWEAGCQRSLWA